MNKVNLPAGTYAVDDALQGFDIIEKPSSNVAFVATCMITNKMYVQFKNGSGYMYSEVDLDTLSGVSAVDSIGKFISSKVVGKFQSAKMDKQLIMEATATKFEYGSMSSKFEVTAENKLTAYCAMCLHYDNQSHLIALYAPEEIKTDSWLSFTGQVSERLDEVFGGEGSFDKYIEENKEQVVEAYKTINQLI